MSLFLPRLCVLCVVSTEQTLIDFVRGGADAHRHRGSSQFMLPVNDSFQDNLV